MKSHEQHPQCCNSPYPCPRQPVLPWGSLRPGSALLRGRQSPLGLRLTRLSKTRPVLPQPRSLLNSRRTLGFVPFLLSASVSLTIKGTVLVPLTKRAESRGGAACGLLNLLTKRSG